METSLRFCTCVTSWDSTANTRMWPPLQYRHCASRGFLPSAEEHGPKENTRDFSQSNRVIKKLKSRGKKKATSKDWCQSIAAQERFIAGAKVWMWSWCMQQEQRISHRNTWHQDFYQTNEQLGSWNPQKSSSFLKSNHIKMNTPQVEDTVWFSKLAKCIPLQLVNANPVHICVQWQFWQPLVVSCSCPLFKLCLTVTI